MSILKEKTCFSQFQTKRAKNKDFGLTKEREIAIMFNVSEKACGALRPAN